MTLCIILYLLTRALRPSPLQSFDRTSTPLKPRPNEKSEPDARFVAKPPDKFSGSEKENLFVMLEVFGDPVPRVEWYKVCSDRSPQQLNKIVEHFLN